MTSLEKSNKFCIELKAEINHYLKISKIFIYFCFGLYHEVEKGLKTAKEECCKKDWEILPRVTQNYLIALYFFTMFGKKNKKLFSNC